MSMSSSSSGGITFSGLASGLDTSSIVSQLVKVESLPIQRLQSQQSTIDSKGRRLTTLQSNLDSLRNAALALNTRATALPTSISSTDESVVKATSTGAASLGSYQVQVDRLASSARVYSNSFASADTAGLFGTGTMSMAIGGRSYAIAVTASDTLSSVVSKINAAGAPVTAGTIYDGTGWRLAISGSSTGSANALTIDEGGLTLGVSSPGNVASQAQDAQFRVDGIAMTRQTNVVSDVVSGVTLQLRSVSPTGTVQHVEVGNDPDALGSKLQTMVDAFNKVNTFISAEEEWTGNQKDAGSLNGDFMLNTVQQRLRTAILSPVAGTSGKYTTLASIGVSLQKDGSLSLDQAKLGTALSQNPNAVATILGQTDTGAMTLVANAADYFTDSTNGVITQRLTSMSKERRRLDDQISSMQARIDKYQATLEAQFATLEKTMSALKSQGDQLTAALNSLNPSSNNK
jgi:flagellar hook-associated protein 2